MSRITLSLGEYQGLCVDKICSHDSPTEMASPRPWPGRSTISNQVNGSFLREAPVTAPAPAAASLLSNDLLGLSLGGGPEVPPAATKAASNASSFSSDLLGLSSNVQSDFDFLGGLSSAAPAAAANSQNNLFNNNTPHTR